VNTVGRRPPATGPVHPRRALPDFYRNQRFLIGWAIREALLLHACELGHADLLQGLGKVGRCPVWVLRVAEMRAGTVSQDHGVADAP
jgi:hypothetical protein